MQEFRHGHRNIARKTAGGNQLLIAGKPLQ